MQSGSGVSDIQVVRIASKLYQKDLTYWVRADKLFRQSPEQ